MRVMVFVKANEESEAGVMPTEKDLADMVEYNDQLVKAGVMLAGEGLQPSSRGKRVRFSDAGPKVVDGPFGAAHDLVAGYWLWNVRSMDEAIDWIKRAPFAKGEEVELRALLEPEEFGEAYTPELRAREEQQRQQIERLHS